MLFGFLLPISTKYSNAALILFYALSIIYSISYGFRFKDVKLRWVKGSTLLLFVPALISILTLNDIEADFQIISRRITFLISPIVFLLLPISIIEKIKFKSLFGLIMGCLITSLYLIYKVLFKYYHSKDGFAIDKDLFNYYHTNVHFMSDIDIHPSYFGMFILLSLFALWFLKPFKNYWFVSATYMIFGLAVLFVNSRIIIVFTTVFMLYIGYSSLKGRIRSFKHLLAIVLVGIAIFGSLFFSLKNTYLSQRFSKELAWELSNEIGTKYNSKNSGDSRVARWSLAIDLIKDKPIFGYGVSKETKILNTAFIENEMITSAKMEYNAHNQFITTTLESGFIGLFFLLYYFSHNLYVAISKKDNLFLIFLLSIFVICLIESYFKRNAGITFVSFFTTLLLLYNERNETIARSS
jgi:O-antigen ligase